MIDLLLARAIEGHRLSSDEMSGAVTQMLEGRATDVQIGALLAVLSARGETVDELIGAATAVRAQAQMVKVSSDRGPLVDTCGTGGDGSGTFNISTAAAIVTAACGVNVAKHGNRSVSSKCGSADVLAALGANIELSPEKVAACIEATRLGFLFAPAHHPAFRHVASVRKQLGVRTLFNLVGPLSNPARAKRQVIGVFDSKWVPLMAEALAALGAEHALVVHGEGLDELSVSGESIVEEVRSGGQRRSFRVTPEEVGLRRSARSELLGGSATENAQTIRRVLAGERSACRDVVLFNAAAALVVAGRAANLKAGVELAAEAIDFGAAERLLGQFVRFTNSAFTTLDAIVTSAVPEELINAGKSAPRRAFFDALSPQGGGVRVIAEVKRASPSAGTLAPISDPVALATRYATAGAVAISVLTEVNHFHGSLADLQAVSKAKLAPALRKDFVTSPVQIANAKRSGASAVLLIAAVLGSHLKRFVELARASEIDTLVEVHDQAELEQALRAGSEIIGINHRDLRTFEIDLSLSKRLMPGIPPMVRVVCESGVRSIDDAKYLRDGGASNLLIGEYLVRSDDPGALIRQLGAL